MHTHQLKSYHSKQIEEISDFWIRNDYFKGIDAERLKRHLRWKYDRRFAHLWVVQAQDKIIGSCGRLKRELLSNGKRFCQGPWGIDSLVEQNLSKEQRRNIFLKVYRNNLWKGYKAHEREIGFCFPNEVVKATYLRTGWLDVPVFFKYSKVLRPDYFASNDSESHDDLKLSLISKFDPKWDDCWIKFSKGFSLVALREHAYLNWRFFKNQDKKYLVFLIKLKNEVKGYIVLREAMSLNKRAGHIVDFLVDQKSQRIEKDLINKTVSFLAKRGCVSVDAYLSNNRYEKFFKRMAFKQEKTDLFVYPFYPELLKKVIKNKRNWFFTGADGDLEMES